MNTREIVLSAKEIVKTYPGVVALDHVSLELERGSVLGLVGENGAGKSTLINVLTAVTQPDAGSIWVEGKERHFKTPQDAFDCGISVVHQERNLISTFKVYENICFGEISSEPRGFKNDRAMLQRAREVIRELQLNIDPMDEVTRLSAAQLQMVEIARALVNQSSILLLDEPSASLSLKETEVLLDLIRKLKSQGVSIIYISHKLEEIRAVCDQVLVLRDGKNVGCRSPIDEITVEEMIVRMVGRESATKRAEVRAIGSEPMLELKRYASELSPKANNLRLMKGEILGLYGLVGSGRTELLKSVVGFAKRSTGEILIAGRPVHIPNYASAMQAQGIYYLSENRKEEGLFLSQSIARNISITSLKHVRGRSGLISPKREWDLAEKYRALLGVKMASPKQEVMSLSGGNQQKVCLARCLEVEPRIIIFDEPTVGIDVKTKSEIYDLIFELAEAAVSVIVISSDMTEIVHVADRILTMSGGVVVSEHLNSHDYAEMSGRLMASIV